MKNKYYKRYKSTLKPLFAVFLSIILSIIAGNLFWGRISIIRRGISSNQGQNDVLESRLDTLQDVIAEAQESSNTLSYTLPQKNPAIIILNHVSLKSTERQVRLDSLSINKKNSQLGDSEINTVNISFDLYGDYNDIFNIITDLSRISPIVNLDSIDIQADKSEGSHARVRFTGFYAALPTKLPPITSPLSDFTDAEKGTINFVQAFSRPDELLGDFRDEEVNKASLRQSGSDQGKTNPFDEVI